MAINFDQDRSGLLGIDTGVNYDQMAFAPGSLKDSLIKNLYNIEQETGFENPQLDKLKKEDMQQFQEKGTPLSLPSDAYTAMAIKNFNEIFGDRQKTLTDAFGVPGYKNLNFSGFQKPEDLYTGKFNVMDGLPNDGITKNVRFRDMLLEDLKNLPSDFKTSLGTTKDALLEDFSGLKDFATNLKDKSIDLGSLAISGIGNAIAPGVGFVLNALAKASGPNYRAMIEKDLAKQGYAIDSAGKIVQTGDYATPQNIMAGYNLAAPGITASAFDRYDKIREGIKKGIFKDKIRAQQKLDALGQFALDKERARKAAYDKAIQDAKNAERREQARIDSITAGYGGADESKGATGPTAAGAGMGVGGGYASDFGYDFAKGGIASL
jgi:predicted transcriptional regulator